MGGGGGGLYLGVNGDNEAMSRRIKGRRLDGKGQGCRNFHLFLIFSFLVGCGMAGVTGYYTTLMLSLLAYIADTTTTETRALKMGVFEAITFASSIVGLLVSGEWIQHSGYQPPFLFILVLHIVNMIYITLFLPESLPEDLKLASNACSFGNFKSIRQLLVRARPGGRWRLGLILLVSILSLFTGSTISLMAVLFTKHFPFCWSASLIGFFYGAKSGIKVIFVDL